MNRERFEAQHSDCWGELDALLGEVEKGKKSPQAGQLPALYRQVCHHLALVRARRYGADLEQHLNHLALRGHQQLYRGGGLTWSKVGDFILRDFPRHVRKEARLVLLGCLLFFGPLLAMAVSAARQPELAHIVLGSEAVAQFEEMYDPGQRQERGPADDFLMFGVYIYNNISIGFRTFAGGLFAGIGSIFILLYNGVMIGTIFGYLGSGPQGEVLWPFVAGHGAFELPGIVLAGVAGLKMGLAVLAPGRRRRLVALRQEARGSLPLVYGMIGMLVVAALIEAFWSSTPTAPGVRYAVAALLWLGVITYFLFAGRQPAN